MYAPGADSLRLGHGTHFTINHLIAGEEVTGSGFKHWYVAVSLKASALSAVYRGICLTFAGGYLAGGRGSIDVGGTHHGEHPANLVMTPKSMFSESRGISFDAADSGSVSIGHAFDQRIANRNDRPPIIRFSTEVRFGGGDWMGLALFGNRTVGGVESDDLSLAEDTRFGSGGADARGFVDRNGAPSRFGWPEESIRSPARGDDGSGANGTMCSTVVETTLIPWGGSDRRPYDDVGEERITEPIALTGDRSGCSNLYGPSRMAWESFR